jgi:hypothetical protein
MRSVVFFFFGGSPPPPPLPACAEHPCDERDEGGMPSGVAGGLAGGAAVSFVPPRCRSHSHPRRPAPRLPRSERTASQPPGSAAPPGSPPEPWVEKKTERVVVVLVRIVRPEHLLLFYTLLLFPLASPAFPLLLLLRHVTPPRACCLWRLGAGTPSCAPRLAVPAARFLASASRALRSNPPRRLCLCRHCRRHPTAPQPEDPQYPQP